METNGPRLNLVVLYSPDIERAVRFYSTLGLTFSRHRHGNGPEHYASEDGPVTFEIYPLTGERTPGQQRIGFSVADVDAVVERLRGIGADVDLSPRTSPWGKRAVVVDFDGNRVELTSPTIS